jgi:hypothetical protein
MKLPVALALGLVLTLGGVAAAQTFTPQSSAGLSVTYTAEKAGGSRVLIFGDVRNVTTTPAERVSLLAEGLDEGGHVVSRGRALVPGAVPSRGSAPFEIRLLASGTERRYRVQIESFQFQPFQRDPQKDFQGN